MNFAKFRDKLLQLCEAGNYDEFVVLMDSYPEFSSKWNELCYKSSGDTLAHVASKSGCVNILRHIHSKYSDMILMKGNTDKKSPLHVAAQYGNPECLNYLISCGLPIDPLKRADWTPLMLACTKENLVIIKSLVEAKANLKLKNKDGWTAFHIACREGHPHIINYLLDCDPWAWKTNSNNGRTPLHTATLHGHANVVEILLERGDYNGNESDVCGTTPLMDAATSNNVPIMKMLIEKHEDSAYTVDVLGKGPIHFAAQAGSLDVIRYLVSINKAYVNQLTEDQETPLHFAAKENQLQAADLLCSLGVDVSLENNKQRTALEIAEVSGHVACAKLLSNFVASTKINSAERSA